jgi:hypothetical protein
MRDARLAIEQGRYVAFAKDKLDQIDRHEDGELRPRTASMSSDVESHDARL